MSLKKNTLAPPRGKLQRKKTLVKKCEKYRIFLERMKCENLHKFSRFTLFAGNPKVKKRIFFQSLAIMKK